MIKKSDVLNVAINLTNTKITRTGFGTPVIGGSDNHLYPKIGTLEAPSEEDNRKAKIFFKEKTPRQSPDYHDDTAVCPYCSAKIRGKYDRPCSSCNQIKNEEAGKCI